ncbi:MAG: hypothetical protein ISR50_17315 [Alphaproteobacteria bacterium]|nr:hypothetical protein [Alphaproteobacteria bacterium]MBL6954400.1 hypothetical protein [Alphaproteobacteria bacterium]
MAAMGRGLGFAAAHDIAVPYIDRSRAYYLAMGYPKPYEWAHLAEVPFNALDKPLNQSSITVITTAAPITPGNGNQGAGAAMNPAAAFQQIYSAPSANAPDLGISHLHYDRGHTDAADQGAFMPLPALADAAAAGRIGSVAPRFHGVPTRYSHRLSLKRDGPELLARLREDQTDAAILVAI